MTDFYTACEDAVIDMLRHDLDNRVTYFTADAAILAKVVNKSDSTKLDEGYPYFAITYPGAFPAGFESVSNINVVWDIFVDIFVRYQSEVQAWTDFKAYRSDIFNLFNLSKIGKTLKGTNFVKPGSPVLSGETEPTYFNFRSNPEQTAFLSQRCKLSVTQLLNRS